MIMTMMPIVKAVIMINDIDTQSFAKIQPKIRLIEFKRRAASGQGGCFNGATSPTCCSSTSDNNETAENNHFSNL